LRNDFSFYLTNVQRYDAFRNEAETLDRMTGDIQKLLCITPPPKVEEPEPQIPVEPPEAENSGVPVPVKPSKPKKPKKEKNSAGKNQKWLLPAAIGAALLAVVLLFTMLTGSVSLGGESFDRDGISVRLKDVTLTQADVNKFSTFRKLGRIQLENCTIQAQDLSPMTADNLLVLVLKDCGISDDQFATLDFSDLRYFNELCVSGNPDLTNLAGLEACANSLKRLDISDTGIDSFGWLPTFAKLNVIRAHRTGLKDLTILETLIYLEELGLSGNGIVSLKGLENTSKLSVVDLSHNSLTDVSLLSNSISSLKVLRLEHNGLSDLSFLSGAVALQKVYVDSNELTDLNWLKNAKELRILSVSQNRIESISGLAIGLKLNYLNLSHNQLQTIEAGDLVFEEGGYPMVDLRNNELKELRLPQGCICKLLALLGNPDLDLSSLEGLRGWVVYFDFPADVELKTLKKLAISELCIVGCPLNRQVEIEEGLFSERLMTEAEALEEIAREVKESGF
jgi:Leucine-rich repeat (LRR) protein